MTQQEFVKNEYKAFYEAHQDDINVLSPFSDGLTKGLEIAKELLDFAVDKYFSVERLDGKTYWAKLGLTANIEYLTTSELLEIFLNKKHKSAQ